MPSTVILRPVAANGRLTGTSLALVQDDDLFLATGTANAWRRLKQAAWTNLRRNITIAKKAGAYRSVATQAAMQRAYDSRSAKLMAEWNMDPTSRVRPSDAGGSNHGWGLAVDIVGTPIDAPFITLARRYGFSFPFLHRGDARHALHDGRTSTSPIIPPVDDKRLARYLNGRNLGKQTDTEKDGVPGRNFWWLLQTAGHRDKLYPTPPYKIDGIKGPKTLTLRRYYWEKLIR